MQRADILLAGRMHHFSSKPLGMSSSKGAGKHGFILVEKREAIALRTGTGVANDYAVYNNLGFHWATSLLAFLTLVMLPFP
jgi:hypothetical protein